MNPNIQVINKNLWAVNFNHVQMKWIGELFFLNESGSSNKYAALSEDGKLIVNTATELHHAITGILSRIMQRTDVQLTNELTAVKKKVDMPHDDRYEELLLCMLQWELKRRCVRKEYMKRHRVLVFIENLKERGNKLWQRFRQQFK